MGVVLYVAPFVNREEMEEEDIESREKVVAAFNRAQEKAGRPIYDQQKAPGGQYWNSMHGNDALDIFVAFIERTRMIQDKPLALDHITDPRGEDYTAYLPVEAVEIFPHPEGGIALGSAHKFKAQLEGIGERFGIPFEKFEMDFSGDGEDQEEAWGEIIAEMREAKAMITRLPFNSQITMEEMKEQIAAQAEMFGMEPEEMMKGMIESHGSLEKLLEETNASAPTSEQVCDQLVRFMASCHQGCKHAIATGQCFMFG